MITWYELCKHRDGEEQLNPQELKSVAEDGHTKVVLASNGNYISHQAIRFNISHLFDG